MGIVSAKMLGALAGAAGLVMASAGLTGAGAETGAPDALGPEAAYEARIETMKLLGASVRSVGGFVRGAGGSIEDVAAASAAMAAALPDLDHVLILFPEGSNPAGSDARDEIWTDWETFSARSQDLVDAIAALDAAAQAGDEAGVTAAFPVLGASCGACHESFRN